MSKTNLNIINNNQNTTLIDIKVGNPGFTSKEYPRKFTRQKITQKSFITKEYLSLSYRDNEIMGFTTDSIFDFTKNPYEFCINNTFAKKDNEFSKNYLLKINNQNMQKQKVIKEFFSKKLYLEYKKIYWNYVTSIFLNIDNKGNYQYVFYKEDNSFLKAMPDAIIKDSCNNSYTIKVVFSNSKELYKELCFVNNFNRYKVPLKSTEYKEYLRIQNKVFDISIEAHLERLITDAVGTVFIFYFTFNNENIFLPILCVDIDPRGAIYYSQDLENYVIKYKNIVFDYLDKKISIENLKTNFEILKTSLENLINPKRNLDTTKKNIIKELFFVIFFIFKFNIFCYMFKVIKRNIKNILRTIP